MLEREELWLNLNNTAFGEGNNNVNLPFRIFSLRNLRVNRNNRHVYNIIN